MLLSRERCVTSRTTAAIRTTLGEEKRGTCFVFFVLFNFVFCLFVLSSDFIKVETTPYRFNSSLN